jgi:hypothetical protein
MSIPGIVVAIAVSSVLPQIDPGRDRYWEEGFCAALSFA